MTFWNLCNFSFFLWSGVRPEEFGGGTGEHLNISFLKLSLHKQFFLTNSSRLGDCENLTGARGKKKSKIYHLRCGPLAVFTLEYTHNREGNQQSYITTVMSVRLTGGRALISLHQLITSAMQLSDIWTLIMFSSRFLILSLYKPLCVCCSAEPFTSGLVLARP